VTPLTVVSKCSSHTVISNHVLRKQLDPSHDSPEANPERGTKVTTCPRPASGEEHIPDLPTPASGEKRISYLPEDVSGDTPRATRLGKPL
jgi:hypothetical protein